MKRFFASLVLSFLLFSPSFADGVKIDGKNLTFDTPDLKAKLSLDGTELSGKDVSWSVADPYVVSVDEEGNVVSLSGGETVVTAASGSSKVDFSVKVEEPSRAPTSDVLDAKSLSGKIEVVMCGDSIMRDYAPNAVDQYGLGQAMKEFWDSSKVEVDNSVSNGGRSSRYFYNEPSRWPTVKKMLEDNRKSGKTTVVFFSFGHNDQRSLAGGDSKVGPYGASFTFAERNQNGTVAGTHYDYIERYIVETRELGGIPVMLSPFVRKYLNNGKVTEKGRHNMEAKAGGEREPRGNYPEAMRKAAEKHNAIFVDMTKMSAEEVADFEAEKKTKLLYISSDSTHERKFGAFELASLVTKDLKKRGYFSDYIVEAEPRAFVGANTLSFGRCDPNTDKILSFDISLFCMDSGKLTLKAPKCYSVSLSKNGEYSSKLEIDCSKIKFGTEIFVKFTPAKVSDYNGKLELFLDSAKLEFGNFEGAPSPSKKVRISLSGSGKEKITDGKMLKVAWPLVDSGHKFTAKASVESAAASASKVLPLDARVVGLDTLEPDREFSPDDEGEYVSLFKYKGGTWPVNDSGAMVEDCYIEFAIPASKQNLVVNGFSFFAGSSGSKDMRWHAFYSTDKDFKNPTQFVKDGKGSYKDVTEEFSTSEALGLSLKGKGTVYVRIYPANKDTKENSENAFMLSNFTAYCLIREK